MAYLRTIVGRHGRRVHKSSCPSCAAVLYRFERFCPACGANNDRFDSVVFERFARASLATAVASCVRDPHHTFERGDPVANLTSPSDPDRFCSVCGIEMPPDPLTIE
jgi:uncharacterized OB-fold protein